MTALRHAVEEARRVGRTTLGEAELFPVLDQLGWGTPVMQVHVGSGPGLDLSVLPGDRVVVKRLDVAHRTEVGGVRVVPRTAAMVRRTARELGAGHGGRWAVQAWIGHDRDPGGELLLGARWSPEFGTVVSLGPGGVGAEAMAALMDGSGGVLHLGTGACGSSAPPCGGNGARRAAEHAGAPVDAAVEAALASWPFGPLALGTTRGRAGRVSVGVLAEAVTRFLRLAEAVVPALVSEIEINPLVLAGGGPVALDALARLSADAERPAPAPAPMPPARRSRLEALLRPRSIALVGVSRGDGPGRTILRNVLGMGYPAADVRVVKAGLDALDGCACVPDVDALEGGVDLLVVSVPAGDVPPLMERVVAGRRARSIVLVSGGLGEAGANAEGADRVRALLRRAGHEAPVLNGGNCLGVRSYPGRYDTLFIPRERLAFPEGPPHPVAVISQSGAFAIARASALPWLSPRYLVTVGNQMDVTVGEYLEHLADDPEVRVFACYVEGFRPLDGARFLRVARRLAGEGRAVILYRAGRTQRGAEAAISHTASLAGDYALTRALARAAGVLVADTLDDFDDLLRVATLLDGRSVGARLGALSNAGFECVALADGAGGLELAPLAPSTARTLAGLVAARGLEGIVAPRNPMDVTPIFDDGAFLQAVEAVVEDPEVDVGVVGCVPLTPALRGVVVPEAPCRGRGGAQGEPPGDLACGLRALRARSPKAWVAAVDGGSAYDAFARRLEEGGVPVFRRGDRAVGALARYVAWRTHPFGGTPPR